MALTRRMMDSTTNQSRRRRVPHTRGLRVGILTFPLYSPPIGPYLSPLGTAPVNSITL
jgi:hypothetical protein